MYPLFGLPNKVSASGGEPVAKEEQANSAAVGD